MVFRATNTPNKADGASVTATANIPKIKVRCTTATRRNPRLAITSSCQKVHRRSEGRSTTKSAASATST
ncbi:Uncharacterised protein [Mycobacteroides abscessus subsp. abscessus]|nr:Uncharacterised protein [Mycobacteroides abscessus subsp. abscessus]